MYSKLVALIHKVLVLLLAWNLAMGVVGGGTYQHLWEVLWHHCRA